MLECAIALGETVAFEVTMQNVSSIDAAAAEKLLSVSMKLAAVVGAKANFGCAYAPLLQKVVWLMSQWVDFQGVASLLEQPPLIENILAFSSFDAKIKQLKQAAVEVDEMMTATQGRDDYTAIKLKQFLAERSASLTRILDANAAAKKDAVITASVELAKVASGPQADDSAPIVKWQDSFKGS
eukprot:7369654-Pyramimonas_sp.AAC.1